MRTLITALATEVRAATAIEYALIAAFIAIAIVGSAVLIGVELNQPFTDVSNGLAG